jgi:rhodanese-related sulfurtransferase
MATAKHHNPGFLKLAEAARAQIREIPFAEVARDLAAGALPYTLLDVREDAEWAAGHLPHAVHLGRGVLERDVETRFPDPETPLVLYCGGGYRLALAAETLTRMGYRQVRSMAGGYRGWIDAGHPLTGGKKA